MRTYTQEFQYIQQVLERSVKQRHIDFSKLRLLDVLIKRSEADEIQALKDDTLPLDYRRHIFNAFMDVNEVLKGMNLRLRVATKTHENPTTAERALELMPHFFAVSSSLDSFLSKSRSLDVEHLSNCSWRLYKTASALEFSRDVASQLKDAHVTPSQIQTFLKTLGKNIMQELEIEAEEGPTNEASDRNLSTD
jgi:hypothetical protein